MKTRYTEWYDKVYDFNGQCDIFNFLEQTIVPRNNLTLESFKIAEKTDEAANVGANNQPAVTEQPAAGQATGGFFLQLKANLRNRSREMIRNKLSQIATSFPGIEKMIKVSVDIENMD